MYIMHNMPVVSECKLNQEDIVGEPLSTSVQCPEIPLSASFLPSFPPSLPPSLLPSFLPSFLPSLLGPAHSHPPSTRRGTAVCSPYR